MSPLPRTVLLQLFVAERSRVVALVRRIVGCRATAEDLAQDTLLRLWGRPVAAEDRSLLFRTAQNLAIDHLRERRVRVGYARAQRDPVEERGPGPEVAGATAQEFDLLLGALGALPERTQRIFLLNRLDGRSYAAISRDLGLSVSTVEKEMMRALDACRRSLE